MLLKLCYLYQKSPKCLRELRELSEAYDKLLPKLTEYKGTKRIDHKHKSLEVLYENYGIFIVHLESLEQTGSKFLNEQRWWKHVSYIIHTTIYLDILSPLRWPAVALQQGIHDSIKAVRRIHDFTWTIAKLKLLIDESLDNPSSKLTYYKQLLSQVEVKDDKKHYQTLNCWCLILPKTLLHNITKKLFWILVLLSKLGLATWLLHLFLTILYVCQIQQCGPPKM